MDDIRTVKDLISNIEGTKKAAIINKIIKEEKPLDKIEEKEIPHVLPNGWEWIRLGNYALKITDYVASGSFASLKKNVLITNETNYALMVKTADFSNGFTKNLTFTDKHGYEFLKNSNLFGGELILSNIGSIGKVFIVPYLRKPMTLASNSIMIKMTDESLIKYLYYYFLSSLGQRTLMSISSGTSMKKFNKTQLKNILIPVAPTNVQHSIVKQLDHISNLIELMKKEINYFDELVKARFIEMFGSCMNIKAIGEVIDICRGASPRPISKYVTNDEDGINWIKIGDASENSMYITSTKEKITQEGSLKSRFVHKGDFILSNSMSFGRPYILSVDGCVHDGWLIFSNFSKTFNELYLYYVLRNDEVQNQFMNKANGATVNNLNSDLVKATRIKVPDIELQNQFADFVKQVDKSKFNA